MNVLLQDKETLMYVGNPGGLTTDPEVAQHFDSGLAALLFCFDHHLAHIQMLYQFDDSRSNFTVPIGETVGTRTTRAK